MKKGSFIAGLGTMMVVGFCGSFVSAQQATQPVPVVSSQDAPKSTVVVTPQTAHIHSTGCASGGCAEGGCDSGCDNGCSSFRTSTGILAAGRPRLFTRIHCPSCDAGCYLEVKQGKTKKTVFETVTKTVCIPNVRLPWRSACEAPSARTRTIKVLKKKSIECPKCEYKWKVPEIASCDTAAPLPKDAKNVIQEPTPVPEPKTQPTPTAVKIHKTSARSTVPIQIVPVGTYRQ